LNIEGKKAADHVFIASFQREQLASWSQAIERKKGATSSSKKLERNQI
jgi:hypothetical protein